jgi:putative DNA primase/helicase
LFMMSDATRKTHWRTGLQLNGTGKPRGNLFNVLHTLRNAEDWKGVLAYDEFAVRVVTKKPPPWADTNVEKWADDRDTRACAWFQEQGINAAVGIVGRGIQTVARENPFHPVRNYLRSLNWDETPRLNVCAFVT